MTVERISSDAVAVTKLADGSMGVYNGDTQGVYSLNSTAAAVWEACASPATFSEILSRVSAASGSEANAELVLDAIAELQEKGLVKTDALLAPRVKSQDSSETANVRSLKPYLPPQVVDYGNAAEQTRQTRGGSTRRSV